MTIQDGLLSADKYLADTQHIIKICRSVSCSRTAEAWKEKFHNLQGIDPAFTSRKSVIGYFVSYLNKRKFNFPYLLYSNYIEVHTTNGEEFSSHVFPEDYLNFSNEEIEKSESNNFDYYLAYSNQEIANRKNLQEEADKKYRAEQTKLKEEKDIQEYQRLKAKYEGDEYAC